ncbi:aminoglycoside phosphotransferase APH(3') [Acrocarpospora corrugata]|uniref:Aminoglycoside phosphotransferase APH(3') n=1 Tax=Acrocarpospora corrugata TaxID=35763 RepID=A0A5M3W3W7_9ACTN|nr:aminoglycoside phosphotransferase APH(3') [Acrocarpospora corrugata]
MAVPRVVRALAGGGVVVPVWANEVGGLTFRIEGEPVRYVKWVASGTPEIDLYSEMLRLSWARRWVAVPPVIEHGADDEGEWLVTAAVPGLSAVDPRRVTDPVTAAVAIGRGLRVFHDALPVDECPFDWGVGSRLANAAERAEGAEAGGSPERLRLAEVRAGIGDAPAIDRLVVCHGDACVPNTLSHADGTFAAHVDLGSLGRADRWADLAVAAWSMDWNFSPGYDGLVYEAYGIAPDAERIAYYRLLWEMT